MYITKYFLFYIIQLNCVYKLSNKQLQQIFYNTKNRYNNNLMIRILGISYRVGVNHIQHLTLEHYENVV